MDQNVVDFIKAAEDHGVTPEALAHISLAMSFRRIADTMETGQPVTLLAQISRSMHAIAEVKKKGL